jgi:hypothetical protein
LYRYAEAAAKASKAKAEGEGDVAAATSTGAAAGAKPFGKPAPFSKRAGVSPSPSVLFPEPSGYMPVRPEDDRRLWTYDVVGLVTS